MTPLLDEAAAGRRLRSLDCGCGTGANLELLARYGPAFGFDLTEAGLRIGRDSGRTRLARATVTAVPFPPGTFDLVTSFDVLYALEEPDERTAVTEMYRLLRPGGYALVNVAAMPALTGDHSVLSHEKRRYTRESLTGLLQWAGFEIARITYTNASLFVPLLLVRSVHRWRGLKAEDEAAGEITVPPAPVNAALGALLAAEAALVRFVNAPFGSSLLCLARKPGSRAIDQAAAEGTA